MHSSDFHRIVLSIYEHRIGTLPPLQVWGVYPNFVVPFGIIVLKRFVLCSYLLDVTTSYHKRLAYLQPEHFGLSG